VTISADPRVSVILLHGNDATFSVSSLEQQTTTRWELVKCGPGPDRAAELNGALDRASGEFVAFLDAGDTLPPEALARALEPIERDERVDLVYTDEAWLDANGVPRDVFFKPDWSPERLLGHNYIGRLTLHRGATIRSVGGVRPEFIGAWEYDLTLRVTAAGRRIAHVPSALYRRAPRATGTRDNDAGRRALDEHLQRRGLAATSEAEEDSAEGAHGETFRLRPQLREAPVVSIIIPAGGGVRRINGENVDLVANVVESVVRSSTYQNFELIVVADEGVGPATRDRMAAAGGTRLRVIDFPGPFNFAHKVNLGALQSCGEHLVLLNDDTAVITPDWIESMLVFSRESEIGAVGAVLRFADGRYQHAGVVAVGGNPGHPYYGFPPDFPGYHQNLRVPCNYLAVTAACLMTRRSVFHEAGGLSLSFPSNYNDVDFCLKVRHRGYRVVCTPAAELYHFESSSRGPGPVASHELELLRTRWGGLLTHDPYYNPNFLPTTANFQTPALPAVNPTPTGGVNAPR
jgi:GT2 family glycosyltransferase